MLLTVTGWPPIFNPLIAPAMAAFAAGLIELAGVRLVTIGNRTK